MVFLFEAHQKSSNFVFRYVIRAFGYVRFGYVRVYWCSKTVANYTANLVKLGISLDDCS